MANSLFLRFCFLLLMIASFCLFTGCGEQAGRPAGSISRTSEALANSSLEDQAQVVVSDYIRQLQQDPTAYQADGFSQLDTLSLFAFRWQQLQHQQEALTQKLDRAEAGSVAQAQLKQELNKLKKRMEQLQRNQGALTDTFNLVMHHRCYVGQPGQPNKMTPRTYVLQLDSSLRILEYYLLEDGGQVLNVEQHAHPHAGHGHRPHQAD